MHPLRRSACLYTALLLTACASGSTSAPSTAPPELRRGVEGTERVVQRGNDVTSIVAAQRTEVWLALQTILTDLRITPTTVSPSEGRLFADGFRLLRLADRRASAYVDCGTGLNGPVADDSTVLANLRIVVSDHAGGGTEVALQVDAEARPRGGIEGLRSCTSTGRMEDLVFQMLGERLSGPA